MQLREFEYVLKIAETHNLSRAAEELFIAQSTLSHALNRIESEVGAPLFDRSRIPLTITAPGEIYIEKAKQILAINTDIKNQIKDINNYQRNELTIGITRFLQLYYLPLVIPTLKKNYPDMKIRIVVDTAPNLAQLLYAGKLDCAFIPPVTQDGFKSTPLFSCKSMLIMSKNNPFAKNYKLTKSGYPTVSFEQLADQDFLLMTSSHFLRESFFHLCKKYELAPNIGLELDSFMALMATVANGYGVTLLPENMLTSLTCADKLAAYNIKGESLKYNFGIVYPDTKYVPKVIKELINLDVPFLG